MVHGGCFSVSVINRTLTSTTGSLTCAQMFMRPFAHGGVRTHVRESALKVDSGFTRVGLVLSSLHFHHVLKLRCLNTHECCT